MPLHLVTPLVEAHHLGHAGQRVRLKLECLQPSGSFKLRGVGRVCETQAAQGARRLLSSSGGNAGLAVAWAGRRLGLPVVVVVPETTRERPKQLMRDQGAEVIVHGASWQEANEHLGALRRADDAFVHPFDDPLLWAGHATMIEEAATQGPKPDAVLLSVGGGGLMCGVLQGLHAVGWHDVPLVAVETEGAASLHAAIAAGGPVTLDRITSEATSLGARRVCDQAWAWTQRHRVESVLVRDDEAWRAVRALADAHRLIVEPACGAALAALAALDNPAPPRGGVLAAARDVLVIVCGGVASTVEDLATSRAARASEAQVGAAP